MQSGADQWSRGPAPDARQQDVGVDMKLEDSLLGAGILLIIGWLIVLGSLL